jgi:xylulokinase
LNYIGVDIGTSGCKSIVFDENGQQLAAAYREYNVIFSDDGGAELDSDEVMRKCFDVIKKSTAQVKAGSVKGLGICSQGEAFTAVGSDKRALCPAMVSSDVRSEPFVRRWNEEFDRKKLYQITGHTAHYLFSLFKLLWLKENRPEVWSHAQKFLCFEDLLQLHLGLDPMISWTLAGRTMLFDVRKHEWNMEILGKVGLRPDQLAQPQPSGSIVGTIDKSLIQELNLAENAFVVTGGHDQPCGALGSGITKPGMAMYATGTVECITPAVNEPIFSEDLFHSNLCTYDHTVEGMYVTVAFSLTGGNILKWFRDEFGQMELIRAGKEGKDVYEQLLENMDDQPSKLLVLPYFTPSGTPYFDTTTKGAIFGMRLSTNRSEFMRALLEWVTFEMRLNLEILEKSGYKLDEIRVIGGGAKSHIWTQLKADVLGKKMTTVLLPEAGCLGVAMLACSADMGIPVKALADKWVEPSSTVYPNDENKKIYDDKFETYRHLYTRVRDIGI